MAGATTDRRAPRPPRIVAALARGATDFLFPPACEACGSPTYGRPPVLCFACHRALRRGSFAFMLRVHGSGLSCAALGTMAGGLARLVHALKYERVSALAWPLGRAMAWRLSRERPERDGALLLVPVAADPRRTRDRGQDHAALLARALGRAAGLEDAPRALRKRRSTPSQTRRPAAERRRALAGSMEARAPAGGWGGRPVLLVDDVVTTGATLAEAKRALEASGAEVAGALVLARTPAGIMAAVRGDGGNPRDTSSSVPGGP